MIVLDIEASGTNYEQHSIVSIGALVLEDPTYQFYDECRMWDGAKIMEGALEVNGFTEEEIRDTSKKTGDLKSFFAIKIAPKNPLNESEIIYRQENIRG